VDELLRAIKPDLSLRVIAAVTTGVVAEASARHGLRGLEVVALGRALTAGLLLTTLSKHAGERMRLALRSSGPLRGLLVDCRGDGDEGTAGMSVRGCLQRHLSPAEHAQVTSLAAAVGAHGSLTVTRDLGLEQRYQGTVDVVSGEVDRDIERYLNVSEQLPSVLACEVVLGAGGTVQRAAGVLCQTFPGGDTEELGRLRALLDGGGLTDMLRQDRGCEALVGFALGGEDYEAMERSAVRFHCTCGPWRARSVVAILGAADIAALADEQPETEVKCEFCGAVYTLTADELRALAAEIRRERS
jgi:molecular chaperone Hsp33